MSFQVKCSRTVFRRRTLEPLEPVMYLATSLLFGAEGAVKEFTMLALPANDEASSTP